MRTILLLLSALVAAPAFAADELARRLAHAAELQALGFRAEALKTLEESFASAQEDGGKEGLRLRGALGQAYLRSGDVSRARPHLEAAAAGGEPPVAAAALNDLGQLHAAEGRAREAAAAFQASAAGARRAQAPLVLAAAAANAARLAGDASLLEEAAQSLESAPAGREADYARVRIGALLGGLRGHALMVRALEAAAARGDSLAESHAAGELGALYAAHGQPAEALAVTRRAVFAAQQAQADESLYRWSWQAARLLARAGEREAALAAYRRALTSLQAVRQDVILDLRAVRKSWRDAVGPLFLEAAELLLARGPGGAAAPQERLLEARNLVEQLKAVELEDYFQDECVAAQLARQKDIDAVEPRTAVVYPILLPARMEILVSAGGRLHQVTVPIAAAELTEQAHGFRRLLEKRTTHQYLPFARRLYAALFAPLEPVFAEHPVDTIVFIPDGPLRGVPVAALYDGRQFLVERFAFATAPGLTLVEPRALAGAERKDLRVLVNGLAEPVQSFPALPYVREELSELEALFAGGRFLRDGEFRVPSFERELRGRAYSIVHIASHGEFDSDPKKSFLLTYDGRLSMDGLERVMKLARFRDDPVELLTLSACRTAAGDDRASLGLAGVAVKAGARSALATLWYVNDQASSVLVADFYRRLGAQGKARALQEAQRGVLADARFRHPGYWAPFLLIGNWL